MLDFIYYPVSFILWCWHKVFGFVFGDATAISWVLGIMFLTFTVRGIMFKPFVKQVRSMRKMQDFAPEMKKVQKKYANDRQRQAQEMQKLQKEHGVNPLGSCLPMLLQIPVFIGLNHVLRMFAPGRGENYFFDADGVQSYVNAKLLGVNIGDAIHHVAAMGGSAMGGGGWNWQVAPVAIPLMIVASIATHFTARHSVARQNPATMTAQAGMMNKLTMYVFPLGVLVFGAFFPLGLLFYWISNNGWTLMQQKIVYTWIDREEEAKKTEANEKKAALAPKPGQKPQPGDKPAPGQKPASAKDGHQKAEGQKSGQQQSGDSQKSSGNQQTGSQKSGNQKPATGQKSGQQQKKKQPGSPHQFPGGEPARGGSSARNGSAAKKKTGQAQDSTSKSTNGSKKATTSGGNNTRQTTNQKGETKGNKSGSTGAAGGGTKKSGRKRR